jgi:hypothetical protein
MKDMNKLNEDQWKTTQVKRNEMRGTDMKWNELNWLETMDGHEIKSNRIE